MKDAGLGRPAPAMVFVAVCFAVGAVFVALVRVPPRRVRRTRMT